MEARLFSPHGLRKVNNMKVRVTFKERCYVIQSCLIGKSKCAI